MPPSLDNKDVFSHHQAIEVEGMEARVISGQDGSFRERIREEGYDVDEVWVGLAIQFSILGEEEGFRLLKVGKVMPGEMNSLDFWPNALEEWLIIQPFNISAFPFYNGILTSAYAEIPFKLKVKEGEVWKTVRVGERENQGYGDIAMRINFVPTATMGGDYMVVGVPVNVSSLGTLGEKVHSRSFPGIRVHKGKFKFANPELPMHCYGLGIQPFYIVSDVRMNEDGMVDPEGVKWPTSMMIVTMLRSAILPNWHWKYSKWTEAVEKGKFTRVFLSSLWPVPIEEDDQVTEGEPEDDSEDGGEFLNNV